MNNKENGTPKSEIIFDTPNEVASQVVKEPKSNVQQEADLGIDDILTDLDKLEDVGEMNDSEEEAHDAVKREEANADENDYAEISSGPLEVETAMEEDDHGKADENENPLEHIEPSKLFKLPTNRLKSIVKLIPSVHMVNSEAIAVIGKATEMFLRELASESYQVTRESGKKTLTMSHVEGVIQTLPQFEFLDGMLI